VSWGLSLQNSKLQLSRSRGLGMIRPEQARKIAKQVESSLTGNGLRKIEPWWLTGSEIGYAELVRTGQKARSNNCCGCPIL
jgi:hypothetical protein